MAYSMLLMVGQTKEKAKIHWSLAIFDSEAAQSRLCDRLESNGPEEMEKFDRKGGLHLTS